MNILCSKHDKKATPKLIRSTILLFVMLFVTTNLEAQQYEINNEHILAPEVSHFVGRDALGVDAKGDLSFAIPIMTIPGRDGLDFDINAVYHSGIQVTQSASWIGLGWSLDIGSITRHPMGAITGEPSIDWANFAPGGPQITSQPDRYGVTLNDRTVELLSYTLESDPVLPFGPANPVEAGECLPGQGNYVYHFVASPWQPWKYCVGTADPVTQDGQQSTHGDIENFIITTEDGTRYVFALPTLSEATFPGETNHRFVSTWRLTAILSPNYPYDPVDINILPDSNAPGGWIRISYEDVQTVEHIGNPRHFSQVTYPSRIETPTHYAEFETSLRYDRDLAYLAAPSESPSIAEYFHKKLDKVSLYRKGELPGDEVKIMEASFDYLDNGAPALISALNDARLKKMLSKLCLKKIQIAGFKGGSSETIPAYKFSYNEGDLSWFDVTGAGNPIAPNFQDDFGYYSTDPDGNPGSSQPDVEGPMWSLTEIIYPEGGSRIIEYESDILSNTSLQYGEYRHLSSTFTTKTGNFALVKQGGARVKEIRIDDGLNPSSPFIVRYSYGNGHFSGIPDTWFRKIGSFASTPFYFSGERGQFNVTYDWVDKIFEDDSRMRTNYWVGTSPEDQIFYIFSTQQIANLQGNRTWNWGEVTSLEYYDSSASPVRKELFNWTFNGHESDANPYKLALVADFPQADPIYINFTHKQLDSKITETYYGSNIISLTETFAYNDGTLLESHETTSDDGRVRRTVTQYAHDKSTTTGDVYDEMRNRNMRSQVAQNIISDGSATVYASDITTWKKETHSAKDKYLPDHVFRWRKNQPGLLDGFNFATQSGSNWIEVKEFSSYDEHGNQTIVKDPDDVITTIVWDSESEYSLIDQITTNPSSTVALTTKYNYDPNTFKLTEIIDPNNKKTEFRYDPLQRLEEVITPDGRIRSQYSYYYSRDGNGDVFSNTDPNHVTTTTAPAEVGVITSTFADGLGQSIQTLQHEGGNSIKAGTIYDFADRPVQITKPFLASNHLYSPDPIADANSYYDGRYQYYYGGSGPSSDVSPYAFSKKTYYEDPLGRQYEQFAPGDAWLGNNRRTTLQYMSNIFDEVPGFAANTLHKVRRTDEDGRITDTFTDSFGDQVGIIIDPGGMALMTSFGYDVAGNLITSTDPKGLNTDYEYNTLNLLRKKISPDSDISDYLYDEKGNLRFIKDAKGAAEGYFIYNKYDGLNRIAETGKVNDVGQFTQANADNASYPSSGEFKVKYYYDDSPFTLGTPPENLKGKLHATYYNSQRFDMTGWQFFSYNDNGEVAWVENLTPKDDLGGDFPLLSTRVTYNYDVQGNVTKVHFAGNVPPSGNWLDHLYFWYEYDQLARLKKVFNNTVDVKPTTPDAEYTYWPTGQVKRLVLGGDVQGVDYLYNSRDWLTQINHQNLNPSQDPGHDSPSTNGVTKDRFSEIVGYNTQGHLAANSNYLADFSAQYGGNISWNVFKTQGNSNPSSLTGLVYRYDGANRLTKANWGYYGGGTWRATNQYDLENILYDENGNLEYMTRHNMIGAATNMDYHYLAGSCYRPHSGHILFRITHHKLFNKNGPIAELLKLLEKL